MYKNKFILALIVVAIAIFLFIGVENDEINKFSNPGNVGKTFTHGLFLSDKDRSKIILKYYSDEKLHAKIDKIQYENESTYLSEYLTYDDFYLSGFKRVGDTAIATYTLILNKQKAWHSSVVLHRNTTETTWQKINWWIFLNFPFGNEIINVDKLKDRWLVTDYVTDEFKHKDYERQLEISNAKFDEESKKTAEQILEEGEKEIELERVFANNFVKEELFRQYEGIRSIFGSYINNTNPLRTAQEAPIELKEVLDPRELEGYYRVYKNPFVLYLRKALNAYLANDSAQACIFEGAVKEQRREGIITGLEAFNKDYYKSKFIVTTIDDDKENGKNLQIIFQDKPDRIFFAWVGNNPSGEICLLSFNSKESFDEKAMKEMTDYYKPYLFDKEHAL